LQGLTRAARVTYALNSTISATLSYTADIGRNDADVLAVGQTEKYRQFGHSLVSIAAALKF
jgi:hypothetical protein